MREGRQQRQCVKKAAQEGNPLFRGTPSALRPACKIAPHDPTPAPHRWRSHARPHPASRRHAHGPKRLRRHAQQGHCRAGRINYHFGGREGLLQATLAEAHRHFISEEELRALADSAQPASEKLRALLALLAKNCVNTSSWHGRALARELGNPSPQLLQMLQAQVPQKARPVLRILSEVSGIPPYEPALLRCAVSTVAPLIMLTVSAIGIPGPAQAVREMPHEVIAEHMYRFALAGLQAVGQAWAQAGGKK